jgi:GT2 family glycosyltransferase
MTNITISIVLYKTQLSLINRLLDCIEKSGVCKKLYIIDNSPEENNFHFKYKSFIEYIWNRKNNGYGGGHNIALI